MSTKQSSLRSSVLPPSPLSLNTNRARSSVDLSTKSRTFEARSYYFSKFHLGRISFAEVRKHYRDWLLGIGPFSKKRERRVSSGINPVWTTEDLANSRDLRGKLGLTLRIRSGSGLYIADWTCGDPTVPQKTWKNVIRISQKAPLNPIVVEHLVYCTEPGAFRADLSLESPGQQRPLIGVPTILSWLLSQSGLQTEPTELGFRESITLNTHSVRAFLDSWVLAPERKIPILLLTQRPGEEFPLNPTELANELRLSARVYTFDNHDTSLAYRKACSDLSIDVANCYGGFAALLNPGISRGNIGFIKKWSAEELQSAPVNERSKRFASSIYNEIARNRAPAQFLGAVALFDRRTNDERRESILEHIKSLENNPAISDEIARLNAISKDNADLFRMAEQENSELKQQCARFSEEIHWLTNEAADLEASLSELKFELNVEKNQRREVSKQIEISKIKSRSESLDPELRESIKAFATEQSSPTQLLQLVSLLNEDRVEVLPDAFVSAKKSDALSNVARKKLCKLVQTLLGPYFDDLAGKKGDAVAKQNFNENSFAATESESTQSNKKCRDARTFYDASGNSYVMWAHLKVGNSESPQDTIRLHFAWDPKKKKIIIGHCGKHLPI
jgi:hypothetical protein